MTQITQEQREHWEAVAARTTAKLRAFHTELTADERAILSLGLLQAMEEAADADASVAGFAMNIEGRNPWNFIKEVGKTIAIDVIYQGLKSVDWREAFSNPSGYPPGPDPRTGV